MAQNKSSGKSGPSSEDKPLPSGLMQSRHRRHRHGGFRSFEQADRSLATVYQGTGLGLSLTRRFAKMHGGSVWAESEGVGKGSTFHLLSPDNSYVPFLKFLLGKLVPEVTR
jgi:hypothetical protein